YEKAGYPLKSARTFEQLLALNPQQGSRLNPAEIHKSLGVLYEVIAESYLSGSPPEAEHPDGFDEDITAGAAPETQKKAKPNVPEAEKAYRVAMNHYQKAIEAGSPESEPIHQQIRDIQAQLQKGIKTPLQ
ncbi:MAG: hypothetical protein VKK59_00685, partial [Vampirovibrionales bacterium]|nr:hypothetical protein [Vampirovibrionales bacterium]